MIKVRRIGHATFETPDGYTVTKNPATGFYQVAQLSADGNALEPASGPGGPLDGAGRTRGDGRRPRQR